MAQSKKRSPSSPKNGGGIPAETGSPFPDGAAVTESIGPEKVAAAPPKKQENAADEAQPTAPKLRSRPRKDQELRQTRARPEEMARAISLLDELVKMFGGSRRHVDKMLGTGRSRTSQLLSGRLELKFQHILDVLDALDIESRAFFEVLYGAEVHAPLPAPLAVVYLHKTRATGSPPDLETVGRVGGTFRPAGNP